MSLISPVGSFVSSPAVVVVVVERFPKTVANAPNPPPRASPSPQSFLLFKIPQDVSITVGERIEKKLNKIFQETVLALSRRLVSSCLSDVESDDTYVEQ